jgi:hypothetical protein
LCHCQATPLLYNLATGSVAARVGIVVGIIVIRVVVGVAVGGIAAVVAIVVGGSGSKQDVA